MKKKIHIFVKTIQLVYEASPSRMIIILIFSFVLGAILPIATYFWGLFIDGIPADIADYDIRQAILFLTINAILLLAYEVFQRINRYNKDMQSDAINLLITNKVFKKAINLNMEQYDDPTIYNQINKINSEALGKSVSSINMCIELEENVVTLIGLMIIIFSYNPIIAFILLLIFVPVLANDIKINSKMYNIYESRIEHLRLVFDIKSLLIKYENVKEIKTYQTGENLVKRIENTYTKYLCEDKKVRKNNVQKQSFFDSIEHIFKLLIGIFIISDASKKKISVGNIVIYINAIESIIRTIGRIELTLADIYNDSLYMESLFKFLQLEEEQEGGKKEIKEIESIKLRNLYFKYPKDENYILKDINLDLQPQRSYLIAGLNGAGKTTLIKIICGIYKPSKGVMLINGIDSKEIDMKSYRKLFATVYQDFIHYPFNVKENIVYGDIEKLQNHAKIEKAAERAGALSYIHELPQKFETQLKNEWTRGTELSIGQWQKIAIARCFYADSQIVILGEPTASLDAISESEIYDKIEEFLKKTTCIVISHRLSVAKLVDQIIVIDDHKIAEEGDFYDLMSYDSQFKSMYSLQADKYDKVEQ